MGTEFFQLAQAAVAVLQAANQPNWAEVTALFVSAVIGFGQIGLIAWGYAGWGLPPKNATASSTSRRRR